MKLIWTNDGNIGIKFMGSDKVIWCDTLVEACRIATAHFGKMEVSYNAMWKDMSYAVDHMARTGDSIAEFGIFGSFMYTTTEPEYEF
jgi:hypothetical protein